MCNCEYSFSAIWCWYESAALIRDVPITFTHTHPHLPSSTTITHLYHLLRIPLFHKPFFLRSSSLFLFHTFDKLLLPLPLQLLLLLTSFFRLLPPHQFLSMPFLLKPLLVLLMLPPIQIISNTVKHHFFAGRILILRKFAAF